jgi:hypothetical protein
VTNATKKFHIRVSSSMGSPFARCGLFKAQKRTL